MNTASAPRTDSPSAVVNANRPCSRFERTIVCLPFLTPATISNRRRLHRYHLGLGRLSTNVMHGIMLCLCDKMLCPCDNERRRFLRISPEQNGVPGGLSAANRVDGLFGTL